MDFLSLQQLRFIKQNSLEVPIGIDFEENDANKKILVVISS